MSTLNGIQEPFIQILAQFLPNNVTLEEWHGIFVPQFSYPEHGNCLISELLWKLKDNGYGDFFEKKKGLAQIKHPRYSWLLSTMIAHVHGSHKQFSPQLGA